MRVESRVPDQNAVDDMVNVARKLLKREWEVTKWGPLAKPIVNMGERCGLANARVYRVPQ
jgi:hypothetical protein